MNRGDTFPTQHQCKTIDPIRDQIETSCGCLNDLLPENHRARKVWEFVESLDVDPLFKEIASFKHEAGRPTTNPKILLALWLYAYTDRISSGRKVVELCQYHDAYRWIAGGAPVNRTNLNDFRSSHAEVFDDLLTSSLAVMLRAELIADEDIAQDGTKVKAFAGFASFRSEDGLKKAQKAAKKYVKKVDSLTTKEKQEIGAKRVAAQKRASQEQLLRVE